MHLGFDTAACDSSLHQFLHCVYAIDAGACWMMLAIETFLIICC